MITTVDLEGVLVAWARSNIPGVVRVVTETPGNLQDPTILPLVQIIDIGGFNIARGVDSATVDVEVFHTSRQAARLFANIVLDTMVNVLPAQTIGGLLVVSVTTMLRPSWRPYDDINVRRVGATYQLVLHQPG